jgi:aspartyl-tRNA(Asn)/glutamyl-tRNA(Gln) amidotransferase subunit B
MSTSAVAADWRSRYETVIGLEVHCQLLTATKIFCACANRFGDPPNTNVCPVCLGLPGALPVLHGQAVTLALRAALATGCTVHPTSGVRAQELLLPRPAEGLPDLAARPPLATGGHVEIAGEAGRGASG